MLIESPPSKFRARTQAMLIAHPAHVARTQDSTNPCARLSCSHMCVVRPENITGDATKAWQIVIHLRWNCVLQVAHTAFI
jgi:hypothetical protein